MLTTALSNTRIFAAICLLCIAAAIVRPDDLTAMFTPID